MLVFLDESFRRNKKTDNPFGVLAGVAIPEALFGVFQQAIFDIRRPYHDTVLAEDHDLKGVELLRRLTYDIREQQGFSYHYNLAEEVLQYSATIRARVFGIICFEPSLRDFRCADETLLDPTFRYLFERIDLFMRQEYPETKAKLVFDDRGRQDNQRNAKAITNFFARSSIGAGYDTIVRVPFFATSKGHNYGLQVADLVTTVIAQKFQGEKRCQPLWEIIKKRMLCRFKRGEMRLTSLKVLRKRPERA